MDLASTCSNGRLTLSVVGDLDIATVGHLQDALAATDEQAWDELHIDMRGVTFMDSSGLHALTAARALADVRDAKLTIAASPRVRRVVAIVALTEHLCLLDAAADATASTPQLTT